MLDRLRVRLTLLYLLAAILLVGALSGSAYSGLNYYFTRSNDTALRYKMAVTFASLELALPADLQASVLEWSGHNELAENENHNSPNAASEEERKETLRAISSSLTYEGELSSVFILPLDKNAGIVINPNPFSIPMEPDRDAVTSALKQGSDIRTGRLRDGSPVRLLTYSIPEGIGFAVLQMGKPVAEQKRLLDSFLSGIALAGGLVIVFMGIGSWWLAGRSLRPAQKAWDMQRSFIANASHELRAPLTLIRASSEVVIRQAGADTRQKDLLKNITDECDHMSQLVEDLLLISKLDSHQLKLDISDVAAAGLLEEVQRLFAPLAEKKLVHVVVGQAAGIIKGDRLRLRQVLIILVDNALRFTPEGGSIELSARVSGRAVTVTVRDNGRGIPAEHMEHLFERFYQSGSRHDDDQGNGLGLSIAKSLAEAHGGTIHIDSQVGEGTRVTIQLPASR
jgi:nitrogen-specific signal transduction histidine kinase